MEIEVVTKRKRVILDSRDRDVVAYPSPDAYVVQLPDDILDVTSVKLLTADVPFSAFLVGPGNRRVPVTVSGTARDALLPLGDYAGSADLGAALATALNAAGLSAFFTVTVAPRTDSLVIAATAPFAIDFSGASGAARLLGFAATAYPAYTFLAAPFRVCLTRERYVVMNLTPNAETLVSACNAVDRSFAVLPDRSAPLSIDCDDVPFEKKWATPQARVSRIGVSFTDRDGAPYDFQNQENRVELLFEYAANRRYVM